MIKQKKSEFIVVILLLTVSMFVRDVDTKITSSHMLNQSRFSA